MSAAMAHRAASYKILVVDDTEMYRQIVRQLLGDRGYEIVEATDGLAGVSAAQRELPDLVVSDVVMPELTGYQLCRFLKNDPQTESIPVILTTATEVDKAHRFWGMHSGADRYIAKERVPDVLTDEVEALLADRVPRQRSSPSAPTSKRKRNIRAELGGLLDKLLFKTTIAHEVRRLGGHVHDEAVCLERLAALTANLTGFRCLAVELSDRDGPRLRLFADQSLSPAQLQGVQQVLAAAGERPPQDGANSPVASPLPRLVDEHSDAPPFEGHYLVELWAEPDRLGALAVFFTSAEELTEQVREHVDLVAQELAPLARVLLLYEEVQRLSVTDSLTRLYNVRHFGRRLEEAYENQCRYGRPFSVVMLDVDHFKRINDQHGHAAGDALLEGFAAILKSTARTGDVVARYGGDEFVLLLPETGLDGATNFGERLRSSVRGTAFATPSGPVRVTTSIGVSEMSVGCRDGAEVLANADAALYEAKRAGRNAVRAFGGRPPDAEGT